MLAAWAQGEVVHSISNLNRVYDKWVWPLATITSRSNVETVRVWEGDSRKALLSPSCCILSVHCIPAFPSWSPSGKHFDQSPLYSRWCNFQVAVQSVLFLLHVFQAVCVGLVGELLYAIHCSHVRITFWQTSVDKAKDQDVVWQKHVYRGLYLKSNLRITNYCTFDGVQTLWAWTHY